MTNPYPPDPHQQPYQPGDVPYVPGSPQSPAGPPPPYPPQQYPPQGGYPPGYQMPPPVAPKKGMGTGKLLLIIGASLIGLCCIGGIVAVAVNGGKTTTSSSSSNGGSNDGGGGAGKAAGGHAKIGQPARDGKFEFTVQKVDCGKTSVGDQFLNKAAQGQFCLITVVVHNIGDEARMFDGSNQKAAGAGA
jgi:hypothetical protein